MWVHVCCVCGCKCVRVCVCVCVCLSIHQVNLNLLGIDSVVEAAREVVGDEALQFFARRNRSVTRQWASANECVSQASDNRPEVGVLQTPLHNYLISANQLRISISCPYLFRVLFERSKRPLEVVLAVVVLLFSAQLVPHIACLRKLMWEYNSLVSIRNQYSLKCHK